jgi:hypothetical protein
MKNLYILFTALISLGVINAQQITFDEDWVSTTTVIGDNGTLVTVVSDPETNGTRGDVVKAEYLNSAADWQNAQIIIAAGNNYIDLRTTKTVTFDVYTDHSGLTDIGNYTGLLKLEQAKSSGGTIEKAFVTSGTGWETITVDFSSDFKNDNGASGADEQFKKIVLFTNYGHLGPDPEPWKIDGGVFLKEDTRYYDNFVYDEGDTICDTASYPVTFTNECDSQLKGDSSAIFTFENGYGVVSSANASAWANVYFEHDALDLSSGTKGFSVKVRGPKQSKVFFKLQVGGNCCSDNIEKRPQEFNYTTPGQWQTIVFDLTDQVATNKTRSIIFFDAETAASSDATQDVFWIDDFIFGEFASLSDHRVKLIKDVSLYPNPVRDVVNISAGESIQRVRVYDLTGRMVKQANPNTADFSLDVADLSKGVYFVKLNAGDREATTKLIK